MAGRLLSVAVTALLVHGCLLPQDDQVIEDLPPARNAYPRIVLGKEQPPAVANLDLRLGTNCPRVPFSVLVEDPDLTDTIRTKWFVDPDATYSGISFPSTPLGESKNPVRNMAIAAPPQLFSVGSLLANAGDHILEVYITDGDWTEVGVNTAPRSHVIPDGDGGTRILLDPTHTDSFKWNVTTNLTPCPL